MGDEIGEVGFRNEVRGFNKLIMMFVLGVILIEEWYSYIWVFKI